MASVKLAVQIEYDEDKTLDLRQARTDLNQLGIPPPKTSSIVLPAPNRVQFYWLSTKKSMLHTSLVLKIRENPPPQEVLDKLSIRHFNLYEIYSDVSDSQPELPRLTKTTRNYAHYRRTSESERYPPVKTERSSPPPSLFLIPSGSDEYPRKRKLSGSSSPDKRPRRDSYGHQRDNPYSPFPDKLPPRPSSPLGSSSAPLRPPPPPLPPAQSPYTHQRPVSSIHDISQLTQDLHRTRAQRQA
jgi:hypothetical protein